MTTATEQIRDLILKHQDIDQLGTLTTSFLHALTTAQHGLGAIYHPLGFIYVPMLKDDSGMLRLHLWLDGGTPEDITTSPYHMHTWNLTSYVHCGSLENQMIKTDADGPLGPYRVFEIVGDRQRGELRATSEEVYARIDSVEKVTAGHVYHIPAGQYHTTINTSQGDLVTVAYVQKVPGTMERNLGPLDTPTHVVERQPCPPEDVARAARTVLARLG
ncbi:hypothetical protein GCM10029963_76400 [Micromonospora andamanensis]|uniref:hypothetical protein n=1 Tax=Micromonospora andamanensis TaxID=1287068 RepID=UPI0019524F19|nr:hypothetical protein [Micromonospora andamanensis]GIJ42164.1 hypothetical protein Vwe01_54890 [Micromonospora andamanensis]